MSPENVEVVERTVDAFAAGGVESLLAFVSADVDWYPFPEWVEESEYRGHEGVRRVFAIWTENVDDFKVEAREFREVGDKVLMLGEMTGRIKGSGVPIRQPLGSVFSDFHNGQIGMSRHFLTWHQALEAVGLRE